MATKLFVGGLSWDTTEDSLRNFFAAVGTVVSATVITDKYTGKSKGFGFVEMGSEEEAQKAMQTLNGQQLDGRAVAVNEAKPMQPREDRGPRAFGGGGGGGGFNRDRRGGDRGGHGGDRGGRRPY
ncbi:RNA-binding protein [Candidatus Gottesmanbacteria bacterium]|nr:RNA-binding protein [Candidatus Gottesmanbacteria bacterium]